MKKKQMFSEHSFQQPRGTVETEDLGSEENVLQYTMVSGISPGAEPEPWGVKDHES